MKYLIIKDIYPSKACFKSGDEIEISIELEENAMEETILDCRLLRLNQQIETKKIIIGKEKLVSLTFHIESTKENLKGYGVEVKATYNGQAIDEESTAFDVLDSWISFPRYGFASDFSESDLHNDKDIVNMNKFHINIVQFYDWMYKHHDFIPPSDNFIDPLGRELSIKAVQEKIKKANNFNMKAMAYGTVYAAGKDFYEKHKTWALYNNNGKAEGFDNFLYIMDMSSENGWRNHIINEFEKVIDFGFNGIHMDQYGFPKEAISKANGTEKVRYLRDEFPSFIDAVRDDFDNKGINAALIFNAVNNWPVESVAKSKEDAVYIEVWPPNDTYQALYDLVNNAKTIAKYKQVILAAYMKPFLESMNIDMEYAENAALMTMAVIFASGGSHLLLGGYSGILDDPYYPNYRKIEDKKFIEEIRRYYDFLVRYEELIYDLNIVDNTMTHTDGINSEYVFEGGSFSSKPKENSIWTLIKEKPGYKIINLVNFTGIDNMNWNQLKVSRPKETKNINVKGLIAEKIEGVYYISPDNKSLEAKELEYEYVYHGQGQAISFIIPEIKIWTMVYIKVK